MLGSADAPGILALMRLIETQSKTTIAAWCVKEAGGGLLSLYERRRPGDNRPRHALDAAKAWLRGEVKLPAVKKIILEEAHAAARELDEDPAAQAAARAIGQAASSIHAATHALGLAFYGAAAFAYDSLGTEAGPAAYERVFEETCGRLLASLQAVAVADEKNPVRVKWYC